MMIKQFLNFKVLKNVLKEIGDDLKDRMAKIDDRVIIEYKDSGEFEAQLRVSGDLLLFQMHQLLKLLLQE